MVSGMANSKEEAEREAEDARQYIMAEDAAREVREGGHSLDAQGMIPLLIQEGTDWVRSQRDVHRPEARPLSDQEVEALERFFGSAILNAARIKQVPRINNPPFYSMLPTSGLRLIDFTQRAGITLIDTILIATERIPPGPPPFPLVFHELVHVVQYDLAGVEEFIKRYVHGWVTHGQDYASIPIERQARELEARYAVNPSVGFSVGAYVRRDGVP